MELSISKEDYLKAIDEAEAEGEVVIPATLRRRLGVTSAAVTMATRRLRRDGHIRLIGGQLHLTREGREIARRIRNRHNLIERMLTEIFEMEWYKVHDEAERLEHAVSEHFEKKLAEKLGTTERCPHGNRIIDDSPQERRLRGWRTLRELSPGHEASIVSVYERDRKLLEHFDRLGLRPGARLRFIEHNSDDTLTLDVGERPVALGVSAAGKIWVAPLEGRAGGGDVG